MKSKDRRRNVVARIPLTVNTVSTRTPPHHAATWMLAACGLWLVALGLYFIVLRPPLLPEDTRFMGSSLAQVRAALPGLEGWLQRVFTVMGGFIVGTGEPVHDSWTPRSLLV